MPPRLKPPRTDNRRPIDILSARENRWRSSVSFDTLARALSATISRFHNVRSSKNSNTFTRPFCAAAIEAKSLIGHPFSSNHFNNSTCPNSHAFCVVKQSTALNPSLRLNIKITSIFPNLAANVANLVRSIGHLHSMAYSIKSIEEANSDGLNLWFASLTTLPTTTIQGKKKLKKTNFYPQTVGRNGCIFAITSEKSGRFSRERVHASPLGRI